MTRICQKSSTSLKIDWTPPNPLGDTTGYRINYYSSVDGLNPPVISTVPVLGGPKSTSFVVTGLSSGVYYYLAVEGLSDHFYSGKEQGVFHLFYLGEGSSRCDWESGDLGGGDGEVRDECRKEGSGGDKDEGEEGGGGVGSGGSSKEGAGETGEGGGEDMVVLAGLVGVIIGGVAGCLATGGLVFCVHWTRSHRSSTP